MMGIEAFLVPRRHGYVMRCVRRVTQGQHDDRNRGRIHYMIMTARKNMKWLTLVAAITLTLPRWKDALAAAPPDDRAPAPPVASVGDATPAPTEASAGDLTPAPAPAPPYGELQISPPAPAATAAPAQPNTSKPAPEAASASSQPKLEAFGHLGFVMAFVNGSTASRLHMDKTGGLVDAALGMTVFSYLALGVEGGWLMFGDASPPEEGKLDASVSLTYGGLFAGLRSPPLITGEGGFRIGGNIGHDWISASRSYSYAGDTVTCSSNGGCSSTHHDSIRMGGGNYLEGLVAYGFAKRDRPWVGGIALSYRQFLDGGPSKMIGINFGVF